MSVMMMVSAAYLIMEMLIFSLPLVSSEALLNIVSVYTMNKHGDNSHLSRTTVFGVLSGRERVVSPYTSKLNPI